MKIYIVLKEYKNWEGNSNGAEIIGAYRNEKDAIAKINKEYKNEIMFFKAEGCKVLMKEKSFMDAYFIKVEYGDIEIKYISREIN